MRHLPIVVIYSSQIPQSHPCTLASLSMWWMRAPAMLKWRSGGQALICPRLLQSLSAPERVSLSLQKVRLAVQLQQRHSVMILHYSVTCWLGHLSLWQRGWTTLALVVTWTLPLEWPCRRSEWQSWMTWDSRSWRGLRPSTSCCGCPWMPCWESPARPPSPLMIHSLTVSLQGTRQTHIHTVSGFAKQLVSLVTWPHYCLCSAQGAV